MKWLLLVVALFSLSIVTGDNAALACSGPEPVSWSLNYMLNWSDYFVKAKIVDMDAAGQNATLEVEYSIKGIPPARLLLYNTNPIIPQMHITHGYDTMCDYSGRFRGQTGDSGFFPLRRKTDGSYTTLFLSAGYSEFSSESIVYLSPDLQNVEEDGYAWDNAQLKRVSVRTESEFVALAQYYGAGAIQEPDTERDIMAFAPVRIRTDTGEDYIVPIDGSFMDTQLAPTPIDILFSQIKGESTWMETNCQSDRCLTFSPDMTLAVVPKDQSTLYFGYSYWDHRTAEIPGQFARFSPSNDAMIVWDNDHFAIYRIMVVGQQGYLVPVPVLMHVFEPLFQSLMIPDSLSSSVHWSQNGNFLAYGDDNGIWVFDLYFSNQPDLVAKSDGKHPAQAMEISDDGRFIAYDLDGDRQSWTLLDRNINRTYQNMLITPNRRHAIGIELNDLTHLTNQVPFLSSVHSYELSVDENWSVQWINGDGYIIKMCSKARPECRFNICDFGNFDYIEELEIPCESSKSILKDNMGDADFAPNLGIVVGSQHQLSFYSRLFPYTARNLDLKGNIIDVQWLPPLYYFRSQQ